MKLLRSLIVTGGLAMLALLAPARVASAQNPDSAAVTQLLDEVKTHAALADDDAHTLYSYTRSKVHWSSHAYRLDRMKEHVNDLIRDSNQMVTLRAEGSPWQQEAIDRISFLLPEIADHLRTTIDHLNDNQSRTQMKAFQDLLETNQTLIHNAHEAINDLVDYGKAKVKAEALEKQLQMPTEQPGF